jgi:tetraacyldisaccharide 4'-kinase
VAAAQQAIAQYDAGLILLDDAFQHRRLHRDLDVVLVDACEPDGYGHVFPRGTLREPLAGLRRADVVILSRTEMVDDAQRRVIWDRLTPLLADEAIRLEVAHQPTAWRARNGPSQPLDMFRGKQVVAFCGIGNPAGFRHSLQACQCEIRGFREFPDHHPYSADDLRQLDSWVLGSATDVSVRPEAVVCTLKDLVKLDRSAIGGLPLVALEIGMRPRESHAANWNEFERLLKQFVSG